MVSYITADHVICVGPLMSSNDLSCAVGVDNGDSGSVVLLLNEHGSINVFQ